MTIFRAAAGSGDDWMSACDDCLSTLGELRPRANFGILYVNGSLAHALDLIAARLRDATGIEAWVGSGGAGVCTSMELADRPEPKDAAISILVATLPGGSFRLFDGVADRFGDATPSGAGTDRTGRDERPLAIVHGDPRQTKTPSMIERLRERSGAFLVGGLTSAIGEGVMQIAGHPTEGGLSGALMSPDLPVITGLTQGCTPIGPVRTVTGQDGAWITTLDDGSALDRLKEDVGPVLARNPERMNGFILAARMEGGLDQDDYLVRDLGGIDPLKGFVMVGDDLRRGDRICFVKRDPEGAKTDLRRLTSDLKRRAEGRTVSGALYHACIGRGRHLFGSEAAELAIIEEGLGPIPLAGLYTNGEIFRDRLYGYSAVLTLFLEEA